jgi:hypothetical protein
MQQASSTGPSNADVLLALRKQVGMAGTNSAVQLQPDATMVRKLDLSYNCLTPQAFVDLAQVLPHSTLRSLDLGSDHASEMANRMGEVGASALAAALASLTCPLQELKIAGVGSSGFLTLVKHGLLASAPYSQLQTLDVRGNWLSNDAFNLLMRACQRGMCHLTHLTLSKNRFSQHGAHLLFEYVKSTTVLKFLDLSMCCITSTTLGEPVSSASSGQASTPKDFFTAFFESMARNPKYCSLEELVLDENNVGDIGSKQIGLALALLNAHIPNLKALSMVNCNMSDMQWFSYGLSRNTTLTKLNLSSNPVGDGGSIALALALQGRLELDAPLQPIFTLRRPLDDDDELAAREEEEAESESNRLLESAVRDPSAVGEDDANPAAEMNLDLLRDDGLRKVSPAVDARNLRAVPRGFKPAAISRVAGPAFPTVDTPEPTNVFYDLQPQQLNAARLANAKRVIIYSKKSAPLSQLLHLNLTHVGMGDVGCLHFSQVIGLNHALKELLLSDNDLTTQSGLALLNTLKNLHPPDSIKLTAISLKQNRISSDLMERIAAITRVRRAAEHRSRLRSYQVELSTFRKLQRSKFAEFIVAIQGAMDSDDRLRRELKHAAEDLARTRLDEAAKTSALQAELDVLRNEHATMYSAQLPQYSELLSRRVSGLQQEHAKKEELLAASLRAESKHLSKLAADEKALRSQIDQEKAEALLDAKPLRQALENELKAVAAMKQSIQQVKHEKNTLEREVIRTYFAILRNCGKGVSELLDPDDPEHASRASADDQDADHALLAARKKRAVFFGAAVQDVEAEVGRSTGRQALLQKHVRPTSPRLASALRFLALFPTQHQREMVQLKLIDFARTNGRPIEKMASGKPGDLDRLSPRSRSAVQKLRGDAESEWELRFKQAAELEPTNKRSTSDGDASKKARRKSRGMGVAAPAAAPQTPTEEGGAPGASDGSMITLSIEIVTSLLQLSPLTKVQGSTTIYAMIMHGLNHGSPIFVTLHASPEADDMQAAWEAKYGVFAPNLNRRVRARPTDGEGPVLAPPAPPPLTFSCGSNATSSVLIKLVSDRLGVPSSSINSLSYQEQRSDAVVGGSASGPGDLVRLIREKELKELQAKKKKQAEDKKAGAGAGPTVGRRKGSAKKKKPSKKAPAPTTTQPMLALVHHRSLVRLLVVDRMTTPVMAPSTITPPHTMNRMCRSRPC